jgi:long-chain acyl-CoA synthetase
MINLGVVFEKGAEVRYMAYLPLAHVLEFAAELCFIYAGCVIGYGTVKTLTDTSMRNSLGDLRAFRPTGRSGSLPANPHA